MITEKLLALLDTHADELSSNWVRMLKDNDNTNTQLGLSDSELLEYSRFIYEQLKQWLDWQATSAAVAKLFWDFGLDRHQHDVQLSEIHYGLILARRNLYINILEKLGAEDVVDMQELIAFTSRITYFFDKIGYFVIKGFEGLDAPSSKDEATLDEILTAFRSGASANT
ncbi:MAG: hypothetical protein HQ507_13570 [Candidatus Marinimicrobia bacterium]|nr:hypothetical protein [Candidatus Neomarinimicrobiota bacterium]